MVQDWIIVGEVVDLTSVTQEIKQKILSRTMYQDLLAGVADPQTVTPTLVTLRFQCGGWPALGTLF